MVSKIRLVLKAFALGRYILSHQRSMLLCLSLKLLVQRLSEGAKSAMHGQITAKEIARILFPLPESSLRLYKHIDFRFRCLFS